MSELRFRIYSHADADGGIAAAMFSRHITDSFGKFGWAVHVTPVNHGPGQPDWTLKEVHWPCAILDFTLHPHLLSERFFRDKEDVVARLGGPDKVPSCYWIDHHPTGSSYPFLTADNSRTIMPDVITKWDTNAISTPGLLRTHRKELGISDALIGEFEEFIDLAEIIDGALYADAEAAHDFSSPAIKLQTLFTPSHPCIDRASLYRKLVEGISKAPRVEKLLDSDPVYSGLIEFERQLQAKQLRAYKSNTKKLGNVAVSNFVGVSDYEGLGRFLPYVLHPDVEYAIHVLPPGRSSLCAVSCGINPWNKPKSNAKHLGNYFARYFGGGGHAFVAGGKVSVDEMSRIDELISFIQDT